MQKNPLYTFLFRRNKKYVLCAAGAVTVLNLFFFCATFLGHSSHTKEKAELVDRLHTEMRELIRIELASHLIQDPEMGQAIINNVANSLAGTGTGRELADVELNNYAAGSLGPGPAAGVPAQSAPAQTSENSRLRSSDIMRPQVQRQPDKAVEKKLIQEGGILLPKGKMQVEPTFTTAHFSSHRMNIQGFSVLPVLVIGEISTQAIQRDVNIYSLPIKFGLWNRLQADIKFPYRSEFDRTTSNLGVEKTLEAKGWGDVETGLSYQIARDRGGWIPDTVVSMGVKTPSGADPYMNPIGLGTGFWASRFSLVGVKASDPSVIFGVLNYTRNYARNYAELGLLDPGDSFAFGLGTAIALSYRTAINFQFERSITQKLMWDGHPMPGTYSHSASLKTGFTWTLSEKAALDISTGVGLTTDAPDYIFEVRLPYTF